MNKKILILLGICAVVFSTVLSHAADWSKYDTGMTSLRVTGYQGQAGYIAFYDGENVLVGILWAHDNQNLYWQKASGAGGSNAVNLGTTKLNDTGGGIPLN